MDSCLYFLQLKSGAGDLPALLEAFTAKNRASLSRPKGHRGLLAALRTTGSRFSFRVGLSRRRAEYCDAFALAVLAALGLVLELFVVKKQLLACGEDKVRTAIHTLQNLILEFHGEALPFPAPALHGRPEWGMSGSQRVQRITTIPL